VLTLQGPQGIGKTAFVASLVPDPVLRERIVKLDHHLDPQDKDSQLGAISNLIVEIGELDSSFRKDIARLKGFITRDSDSIRRPYARANSDYPRRTVFAATVNASDFLQDETGNTRFWTIPVIRIAYEHQIDMQQVFAQLRVDLDNGARWWLTREEEALLNDSNRNHLATSPIREGIMELVDLDRLHGDDGQLMTTSDVLRKLGIDHPRNGQNREVAAILRDLLGEPKKIRGNLKWRVPLAQESEERKFGNLP
jgi:putative DNA primase/helicase